MTRSDVHKPDGHGPSYDADVPITWWPDRRVVVTDSGGSSTGAATGASIRSGDVSEFMPLDRTSFNANFGSGGLRRRDTSDLVGTNLRPQFLYSCCFPALPGWPSLLRGVLSVGLACRRVHHDSF